MTSFSTPTAPGMRPGRAIALVTRRELKARVFTKGFLISLLVTGGLIIGIFVLGSVLSSNDPLQVGVLGQQPEGVEQNLASLAEIRDDEVEVIRFDTRAEAEAAIVSGEVSAVVVEGSEVIMDRTDNDILGLISPAWQQANLVDGLVTQGLSESQVGEALSGGSLRVTELDPDPESDARIAVAFATVILLFISVQVAGSYIMMGVFEEKGSKIVELVLASIPARYLLAGKVLGVGVLGLVQVAVLAGSALIGASLTGSSALPALSPALIGTGIIWFLLGYLLYGSVFAAGASLAPRQEDAQSTLGPITVILMLSYFASIFVATDPGSTASRIISWIPFASPFTMPGRTATGDALWWEVVGSMLVTGIAAGTVLIIAERVYVRSIIHTDRKLGWREAWSLKS